MKRFTFLPSARRGIVQQKIEDEIDFPVDHLDLEPYIIGPPANINANTTGGAGTGTDAGTADPSTNANANESSTAASTSTSTYKLFGVVEHTGQTSDSGHYKATVRNSKDHRFYNCNDSHIGDATDNFNGSEAYLLFYKRKKGWSRWAGMERIMQYGYGYGYNNAPKVQTDEDGFTIVPVKKKKYNANQKSYRY